MEGLVEVLADLEWWVMEEVLEVNDTTDNL